MAPARHGGAFDYLARILNGMAGFVMCVMMMVTVSDVFLRSVLDLPIFGTFDIVELTLVTMIFLALPETFRQEDHIVVDIVDHIGDPRLAASLRVLGMLLAVGFLAFMLRYSVNPAYDTYRFNEETLDLGIPRYIHWLPILFGTAISILVGLVTVLRNAARARDTWRGT